ncbi:unnamed protein product [Amoebophrya sp. A120]|nr:unnamed protein product [Amoebophrya sp. A120]|eukprot:GSA120T00015996001.1
MTTTGDKAAAQGENKPAAGPPSMGEKEKQKAQQMQTHDKPDSPSLESQCSMTKASTSKSSEGSSYKPPEENNSSCVDETSSASSSSCAMESTSDVVQPRQNTNTAGLFTHEGNLRQDQQVQDGSIAAQFPPGKKKKLPAAAFAANHQEALQERSGRHDGDEEASTAHKQAGQNQNSQEIIPASNKVEEGGKNRPFLQERASREEKHDVDDCKQHDKRKNSRLRGDSAESGSSSSSSNSKNSSSSSSDSESALIKNKTRTRQKQNKSKRTAGATGKNKRGRSRSPKQLQLATASNKTAADLQQNNKKKLKSEAKTGISNKEANSSKSNQNHVNSCNKSVSSRKESNASSKVVQLRDAKNASRLISGSHDNIRPRSSRQSSANSSKPFCNSSRRGNNANSDNELDGTRDNSSEQNNNLRNKQQLRRTRGQVQELKLLKRRLFLFHYEHFIYHETKRFEQLVGGEILTFLKEKQMSDVVFVNRTAPPQLSTTSSSTTTSRSLRSNGGASSSGGAAAYGTASFQQAQMTCAMVRSVSLRTVMESAHAAPWAEVESLWGKDDIVRVVYKNMQEISGHKGYVEFYFPDLHELQKPLDHSVKEADLMRCKYASLYANVDVQTFKQVWHQINGNSFSSGRGRADIVRMVESFQQEHAEDMSDEEINEAVEFSKLFQEVISYYPNTIHDRSNQRKNAQFLQQHIPFEGVSSTSLGLYNYDTGERDHGQHQNGFSSDNETSSDVEREREKKQQERLVDLGTGTTHEQDLLLQRCLFLHAQLIERQTLFFYRLTMQYKGTPADKELLRRQDASVKKMVQARNREREKMERERVQLVLAEQREKEKQMQQIGPGSAGAGPVVNMSSRENHDSSTGRGTSKSEEVESHQADNTKTKNLTVGSTFTTSTSSITSRPAATSVETVGGGGQAAHDQESTSIIANSKKKLSAAKTSSKGGGQQQQVMGNNKSGSSSTTSAAGTTKMKNATSSTSTGGGAPALSNKENTTRATDKETKHVSSTSSAVVVKSAVDSEDEFVVAGLSKNSKGAATAAAATASSKAAKKQQQEQENDHDNKRSKANPSGRGSSKDGIKTATSSAANKLGGAAAEQQTTVNNRRKRSGSANLDKDESEPLPKISRKTIPAARATTEEKEIENKSQQQANIKINPTTRKNSSSTANRRKNSLSVLSAVPEERSTNEEEQNLGDFDFRKDANYEDPFVGKGVLNMEKLFLEKNSTTDKEKSSDKTTTKSTKPSTSTSSAVISSNKRPATSAGSRKQSLEAGAQINTKEKPLPSSRKASASEIQGRSRANSKASVNGTTGNNGAAPAAKRSKYTRKAYNLEEVPTCDLRARSGIWQYLTLPKKWETGLYTYDNASIRWWKRELGEKLTDIDRFKESMKDHQPEYDDFVNTVKTLMEEFGQRNELDQLTQKSNSGHGNNNSSNNKNRDRLNSASAASSSGAAQTGTGAMNNRSRAQSLKTNVSVNNKSRQCSPESGKPLGGGGLQQNNSNTSGRGGSSSSSSSSSKNPAPALQLGGILASRLAMVQHQQNHDGRNTPATASALQGEQTELLSTAPPTSSRTGAGNSSSSSSTSKTAAGPAAAKNSKPSVNNPKQAKALSPKAKALPGQTKLNAQGKQASARPNNEVLQQSAGFLTCAKSNQSKNSSKVSAYEEKDFRRWRNRAGSTSSSSVSLSDSEEEEEEPRQQQAAGGTEGARNNLQESFRSFTTANSAAGSGASEGKVAEMKQPLDLQPQLSSPLGEDAQSLGRKPPAPALTTAPAPPAAAASSSHPQRGGPAVVTARDSSGTTSVKPTEPLAPMVVEQRHPGVAAGFQQTPAFASPPQTSKQSQPFGTTTRGAPGGVVPGDKKTSTEMTMLTAGGGAAPTTGNSKIATDSTAYKSDKVWEDDVLPRAAALTGSMITGTSWLQNEPQEASSPEEYWKSWWTTSSSAEDYSATGSKVLDKKEMKQEKTNDSKQQQLETFSAPSATTAPANQPQNNLTAQKQHGEKVVEKDGDRFDVVPRTLPARDSLGSDDYDFESAEVEEVVSRPPIVAPASSTSTSSAVQPKNVEGGFAPGVRAVFPPPVLPAAATVTATSTTTASNYLHNTSDPQNSNQIQIKVIASSSDRPRGSPVTIQHPSSSTTTSSKAGGTPAAVLTTSSLQLHAQQWPTPALPQHPVTLPFPRTATINRATSSFSSTGVLPPPPPINGPAAQRGTPVVQQHQELHKYQSYPPGEDHVATTTPVGHLRNLKRAHESETFQLALKKLLPSTPSSSGGS